MIRNRATGLGFVAATSLLIVVDVAASELRERELDCLMEPRMMVKIGSPVEGLVDKVLVDRGDLVKQGQALASLESRVEEASVLLARARAENEFTIRQSRTRLDLARRKLERTARLRATDVVAAATFEEAQAEAQIAEAELREAELNLHLNRLELARSEEILSQRTIRSPVDGVIVERQLAPGEYRNTQSPMMTIAQMNPLNVEVYVPIAFYGQVRVGMRAEVRPEAPVGGVHGAEVVVIDRVVDAASGTFGVRLSLPNPEAALPGGLRCSVRFIEAVLPRQP